MKIVKKLTGLLLVSGCWLLSACQSDSAQVVEQESLIQYVEPRIGTAHCRWFHFAPGALPFGLAKPAAATNGSLGNKWGWEASGYDYRDTSIEGFPCFHDNKLFAMLLRPSPQYTNVKPSNLPKFSLIVKKSAII